MITFVEPAGAHFYLENNRYNTLLDQSILTTQF